jgi:hypothetical protein
MKAKELILSNPVILNNNTHRNLRVNISRGAEFGEKIHIVPVIGDELSKLALDFQVYIMKNQDTGNYSLNALMGLEPGENLYLQGEHWAASHLPLHMRRQPFLLAFTNEEKQTTEDNEAHIAIDMDNKRVNESQGQAIFNEDGSKTPYLEDTMRVLELLAKGIESTEAFISILVEHDLIESTQLNITFANGEKQSLQGIYALNAEKLDELKGEVVAELHSRGFLQACYLMVASMGQVAKMIKMKNATLAVT